MNNTITINFCSEKSKRMFNEWWFNADKVSDLFAEFEHQGEKVNISSGNHSIDIFLVDYPTQETRTINGYEVPLPLTKFDIGKVNWVVDLNHWELVDDWFIDTDDANINENCLKRGLVFSTKEAAIQNAKAMLGIS